MGDQKAFPWASYQIRKIPGCACAGNAFPTTDFKGNCQLAIPVWDDILTPLYIDPGVNISYDILTPTSNSTQNSLVGYDQLLNVVYCYLYIIFINSERIG